MLPLRLTNPTAAHAEGYCAAQCLNDTTTTADTRLSKCFISAFGADFPDNRAIATYVTSKIKSGGLGALLLINEIAAFERCSIGKEIRYRYDAGQCGAPNCGNPKKIPEKSQYDVVRALCGRIALLRLRWLLADRDIVRSLVRSVLRCPHPGRSRE